MRSVSIFLGSGSVQRSHVASSAASVAGGSGEQVPQPPAGGDLSRGAQHGRRPFPLVPPAVHPPVPLHCGGTL